MFCKPPHPVYIVLFRGDDTDFVGNQEIIVKITTERNISGCKAYFKYMGNIQTFDVIPENKELHLVFSHEQTKEMPLGTWDAELYLIDENGKRMTVNNRIHMLVTNSVREAYYPEDPQAITVIMSGDKFLKDAEVSSDGKTLTITKSDGTNVPFSGGGGTNDYNDLENKPSINGTTLTGNVNLATPEQLSLKADKENVYTKEDVDSRYSALSDQIGDISNSTSIISTVINQHIRDTTNPHKVTAAQVGAVPLVEDVNSNKTAVTIGRRNPNISIGSFSIANGSNVIAAGNYSHAEGFGASASGDGSHAEGIASKALGNYSHAEGYYTKAERDLSHAEGYRTTASGLSSHVDGVKSQTKTDDIYAYAWNGDETVAKSYYSHGPGTFNINPVGGTDGFYIGEKKLSEVISDGVSDKADKTSLAPEYSPSSAYSVGAFVYHDGNIYQCTTAIADGGEAWNAAHWELRKLDDFFTESNSLLNGRLAYSRNATGLKDRAFNALTFDGTEFNLSTALAAVTPTASGQPRDLLIVATATAATTISFTAGTIKGDKPTIDGSGTWLITLTEYASGVWYCRQIKMEDAA